MKGSKLEEIFQNSDFENASPSDQEFQEFYESILRVEDSVYRPSDLSAMSVYLSKTTLYLTKR